ncbi:MAG: PAS domain S-box protein [Methylophilaceae bacterium]|nr:PAS domain S-box protein [Methylophilaceae bacterium]
MTLIRWIKDPKGVYLDCNTAFERLCGAAREHIRGRTDQDLFEPSHAEILRRYDLEVIATGETCLHEEWLTMGADGQRGLFEIINTPLHDAEGKLIGVLGIARDITLRKQAELALKQESEKSAALLRNASDGIHILDAQGRVIEASDAFCTMLGYARHEIIGMHVSEWDAKFSAEDIARELPQRLREGRAEFETLHRRRDGSIFEVEVSIHPLQLEGQPALFCASRDITARKALEKRLKDSEASLARAQEVAHIGSWTLDIPSNRLVCSDEACRIFGIPVATPATVDQIIALLHPEDRERVVAAWTAALSGAPFDIEYRLVSNDAVKWIHGRASVEFASDGTPLSALGTVQDITRRIQMENALREREQIYRTIISQAADAIVLIDTETLEFPEFNEAAYQTLGYSREEFGRLRLTDINPAFSEAEIHAKLAECISRGMLDFETRHRCKDGTWRDTYVTNRPVQTHDKTYVAAIWHDLTDRLREQHERERLQSQLLQAQKMEAIGQLAGGIAHDFNNILAAILGYTGLALERCATMKEDKLAEYLLEIRKASERARDLIAKILTFSRARGTAQPVAVNLGTLVDEVAKMLRPTLPSSIELTLRLEQSVPTVLADAVDLHQVLTNLIINARDAVGETGHIEIGLDIRQCTKNIACDACHVPIPPGEYAELWVRDDGSGIAEKIRHRIFDPFFTTKETGKGSGMGLAVVHGLVHRHQGHLVLESVPGKGSTFRMLFPAVTQTVEDSVQRAQSTDQLSGHGARVLVVDDEPMLADMLGEILSAHDYRCTVFTDSRQALAAFQADPAAFDVLLADQTMPGLTGDALARKILEIRPGFPIILCTGHTTMLDSNRAHALGIRHFFVKPVPNDTLLSALAELTVKH